jgi:ADP-dependent NAD(P)H-hydrate dehydratase / NAD(P)H-hydrate epimerase
MKPVLTPDQAVELDRAAQARGIPAEMLMERAGRAVARAAVDVLGGTYGRRAVVVCGRGNNGGDGLVAARHLARWGMAVAVVMIEVPEDLREPAATNLERLRSETGARILNADALPHELARADLAVDAIFGTGFRGMPEDEWATAIGELNASAVPVLAVDIPSGVDGASGAVAGDAVAAELTVTFGAAKTGALLLPGAERAGSLRVVDIGFPDDLLRTDLFLTEPDDVARVLPHRQADTHKRASGVLMIVAGSRGMTGAPRLIAEAAGRIGAGLVLVAVPTEILPIVQAGLVETVFVGLPYTADGTVAAAAVEQLLERLADVDALAIGPGMTTHAETAGAVRALVARSTVPVVLDADGLNAYTGEAEAIADRRSEVVLTPHVGEFGRLTGVKPRDLQADLIGHVRRLATEARAVVLLKGSRTVIAAPGGHARLNLTGSPVLATAGSGDVLTGVIGGLLARGVDPLDAAAAGAYLHGVAGTLAGRTLGEGTLAGDVAAHLPAAVARAERTR